MYLYDDKLVRFLAPINIFSWAVDLITVIFPVILQYLEFYRIDT